MRGEKTIELGFSVRVPSGKGEYIDTNIVRVRAPGLNKLHIHARMQASVMEAVFAMARKAASIKGLAEARAAAASAEAEDGDDETADKVEPAGGEVMDQISIGLGPEDYPGFVAYVKKVLTNSDLALLGDEGTVKITDEAWGVIEEAGGIEGAYEIMGTFVAFFLNAPQSRKSTGDDSPTISSLPTKAASQANGRRPPRMPN